MSKDDMLGIESSLFTLTKCYFIVLIGVSVLKGFCWQLIETQFPSSTEPETQTPESEELLEKVEPETHEPETHEPEIGEPDTSETDIFEPEGFELPLEILARVLDFLPQHHVYPFLSLSRGVNYIARYRLFRQVYVLEYHDPILHDVIEDLLCWLVITRRQFHILLRSEFTWPGKLLIIETSWRHQEPVSAIRTRFAPADVRFTKRILDDDSIPYEDQIVVLPPPSKTTTDVRLSRLTLVGLSLCDSLAVTVKVDCLLVVGKVYNIERCIDIPSIKQLTLISAFTNLDDIYGVASQLSSLKDLFVAESPLTPDMLSDFPTNIRRLVLSNTTRTAPVDCCSRFRRLLEYLELGERVYFENWPRVIRRRSSASSAGLLPLSAWFHKEDFPRLLMCVYDHEAYTFKRVLGEWQAIRFERSQPRNRVLT